MSKHRDDIVLQDILNASYLVADFVSGLDREHFIEDWKTRSAVLYQILIIGEAVKRLSPGFREQHADIPWALMAGMRDHLVHGYDLVDWDEVWNTVNKDIPDLLRLIESIS